jgi:hypothetical protein
MARFLVDYRRSFEEIERRFPPKLLLRNEMWASTFALNESANASTQNWKSVFYLLAGSFHTASARSGSLYAALKRLSGQPAYLLKVQNMLLGEKKLPLFLDFSLSSL